MSDRHDNPCGRHGDALDLWAAEEAAGGPAPLEAVRLNADERLLVPFTPSTRRVEAHYLDTKGAAGYVHCGGAGCLLCRIGKTPETRDLFPVYDPVAGAVAVLPVGPSQRPHALRPLIRPVLQRVRDGDRLLVGVRRHEGGRFSVAAYPLADGADDGAAVIAEFCRRYEAGQVDLRSVYQSPAPAELSALPEVRRQMDLRGVTLP
jgi:hypothetical protein